MRTTVRSTAIIAITLGAIACSEPNPSNTSDQPDGNGSGDGGTSSDAPGASASDPANDGPSNVVETTASIPGAEVGRTLAATVYAPSSTGPHALVVISPGYQMARTQYASYARHYATWGVVAVLVDYADTSFFPDHQKLANDVPKVIDWALAQTALSIDATKIAASGHSLGGKISVFAASQDPRIKAVVAWDPVDSNSPSVAPQKMGSMAAAIAVIGETTNGSGGGMPCAPTAENFLAFYAAAPSPALAVTVNGADHMDWVDDPSCGLCGFCTAGSAPNARARELTRRFDVAWLRRRLFDDAAMDPWLAAPVDGSAAVASK